jgi:hypothetical protein
MKCNLAPNLFPPELPDAQSFIDEMWSATRLTDSLPSAGIDEVFFC